MQNAEKKPWQKTCHGFYFNINRYYAVSFPPGLPFSLPDLLFFDRIRFSFCGFSFFRLDCLIRVVSLRRIFIGLIGLLEVFFINKITDSETDHC